MQPVNYFKKLIIGYSKETNLRNHCASGGLLSSLLAERIKKGVSSGAIVARVKIDNCGPSPYSFLALTPDDVFISSGSIYSDFDHIGGIKKILTDSEGVFDVVALPCQIRLLRSYLKQNECFQSKIGLLIGLWCGHATDKMLLSDLLTNWRVDLGEVESFKYRFGHWRGVTQIQMNNGTAVTKSYSRNYGLYQNMYVDCKKRCFSCTDHFAELSDISFGDCWIASEKSSKNKKTIALSMNEAGNNAIQLLEESPSVEVEEKDPVLAVQAQKRAIIWHTYSCKARAEIAKIFGLNVQCQLSIKPRLNDYVSAFMVLFSFRLFNTRARNYLFRLPWWMLFPFMALQKLMLNK